MTGHVSRVCVCRYQRRITAVSSAIQRHAFLLFCCNLSSQMFWSVVQPSCKEIAVMPIFTYGSSWPSLAKGQGKAFNFHPIISVSNNGTSMQDGEAHKKCLRMLVPLKPLSHQHPFTQQPTNTTGRSNRTGHDDYRSIFSKL